MTAGAAAIRRRGWFLISSCGATFRKQSVQQQGGARSGQTGQNATRYRGCGHGYMVDFINQYKMWLILSTCFRGCSSGAVLRGSVRRYIRGVSFGMNKGGQIDENDDGSGDQCAVCDGDHTGSDMRGAGFNRV